MAKGGDMAATLEQIAKAVEPAAPHLSRFLIGPNKKLACFAQGILDSVFQTANNLDALCAAVSVTANSGKVKEAEETFLAALGNAVGEKTGSATTALNVDTKIYARMRKDNIATKRVLSYIVVAGFFAVILLSYSGIDVKHAVREQLNLLIGALIASFTAVIQYYFGSSTGSAEKTLMLQTKEDTPPPAPTPVTPPPGAEDGKKPNGEGQNEGQNEATPDGECPPKERQDAQEQGQEGDEKKGGS
jgi:hypothetical protein